MRKISLGALGLVLMLGMVSSAVAATTSASSAAKKATPPASPAISPNPDRGGVRGTVTAVDVQAKSVTIHPKTGGDQTFKLAANAKVKAGGNEATLANVRTGDVVQVLWALNGKAKEAMRVIVLPTGTPHAKSALGG
jgi:Cu/Ag efflux protein CusF